jgi:hypothetical protein
MIDMSDGFSSWDAIITLSVVLVPLLFGALIWRAIFKPVPPLAYPSLPDYCRIGQVVDTYAPRPAYHTVATCPCSGCQTTRKDRIVRQHSPNPGCQCIHCRKGRTVVRATGPAGVF